MSSSRLVKQGTGLDDKKTVQGKRHEHQRRSVIRIDPSNVVRDVFLKANFMREVSNIEVEADIIELPGGHQRSSISRAADPMAISALRSTVSSALGWEPSPLPSLPPPHEMKVQEMRPTPFHPLDGKQTAVPVPASSVEVTAEWCTLAFRSRGYLNEDEAVLTVSKKPLGEGEGEFSELVLLNIDEVQGECARLPRYLVAKFSPPGMSAIEMAIVFGAEAHFYNDFTPEGSGLVHPEAVYVGFLKRGRCATPLYCIIMCSAMPPDQPTSCFKRVDGCASFEHMALTMKTLAKFHARWWDTNNSKTPLSVFAHPDDGGGALPFTPKAVTHTVWVLLIKNGLKALPHCFADKPEYAGAPKFGEQYAKFLATVRPVARRRRNAMVRELFRHPLTLCHGDAHLENIFFGEQYPGGCAFIDFGLSMFGQALSDVSTVIGGGMPVDARREHEATLVKQYWSCLCEFGVKDYPWELCWYDYQYQYLLPLVRLLAMAPGLARDRRLKKGMFAPELSEASKKLTAMYVQLNTRFATALMDHQWPTLAEDLEVTAAPFCRPCC